MLNVMRENLKSLKWVLWAVAIAMVLYLGSYFIGGSAGRPGTGWVAKIDSSEISEQDYIQTVRNIDRYYAQVLGENFDQFKPSLRMGTEALQQLMQRQMILHDAENLGLIVSNKDISQRIREDPTFQNAAGEFVGVTQYSKQIDSLVPGGVTAFESGIGEATLVERWHNLVAQAVDVDEPDVEQLFRKRTEKTAIRYVLLPGADQSIDEELSDEQLRGWFDAHLDDYRKPERRRVRLSVIDREAQLELVEVTDNDIRSFYETNQSNYEHPEQRRASHVLIQVAADASEEDRDLALQEAEAVLARAQSGDDFAALAQERSQDTLSAQKGGDLGFFDRGKMVPPFEEAAFATSVGELAPLVESQFGYHVILVTDERAPGTTPVDELRDQIRETLRHRKSDDRVAAEAQRLRGEISSAEELAAVVQQAGLSVEQRLIAQDERLWDLGAGPDFVQAVFDLEPGQVGGPLRVARGMALVALDEVVPAGPPTLDEVKDVVGEDILADRRGEAALATARAALAGASDFDALAASLDKELQESGDLAPGQDLPQSGGLGPEHQALLFDEGVAVGLQDVMRVPAGALLFEVTRREPFDAERYANEKGEVRRELLRRRQDQMRESFLNQILERTDVEVNQPLVQRYDQLYAG